MCCRQDRYYLQVWMIKEGVGLFSFTPSLIILDCGQCHLLIDNIFWKKIEETLFRLLKSTTFLQIFSHPPRSFWQNWYRWCRLFKLGVEWINMTHSNLPVGCSLMKMHWFTCIPLASLAWTGDQQHNRKEPQRCIMVVANWIDYGCDQRRAKNTQSNWLHLNIAALGCFFLCHRQRSGQIGRWRSMNQFGMKCKKSTVNLSVFALFWASRCVGIHSPRLVVQHFHYFCHQIPKGDNYT
jgi:hypothetical protein